MDQVKADSRFEILPASFQTQFESTMTKFDATIHQCILAKDVSFLGYQRAQ